MPSDHPPPSFAVVYGTAPSAFGMNGTLYAQACAGKKVLGVRSPMGTGKTAALAALLSHLRPHCPVITSLSHRVALVKSAAATFGLTDYQTHLDAEESARRYSDESPGTPAGLATTIHSLREFYRPPGGIVVIDEVTQVLRTLASDKALRDRRGGVFQRIARLLNEARLILIMDADLDQESFSMFLSTFDLDPSGAALLLNAHRPTRGRARAYASRPHLIDDALRAIRDGQSVYFACSTQDECANIGQRLDDLAVPHLRVDSTTMKDAAVQAWLRPAVGQPRPAHRVVVTSPAVGTGVSIDPVDGRPAFQHVVLLAKLHEMHLNDHLQQAARVRGVWETGQYPLLHYWIEDRTTDELGIPSAQEYGQTMTALWQATHARLANDGFNRDPAFALAPVQQKLIALAAWARRDQRVSLTDVRARLASRLASDGWHIEEVTPPPESVEGAMIGNHVRAREARLDHERDTLDSAPTPPPPDAATEDRYAWSQAPTRVREAGERKAKLEKVLDLGEIPEEQRREVLHWAHDLGKSEERAAEVLQFWTNCLDEASEVDFRDHGWSSVSPTGQRSWSRKSRVAVVDAKNAYRTAELVREGLLVAGVDLLGLLEGQEFEYSHATLTQLHTWCQEHANEIEPIVRCRPPSNEDYVCRTMRTLLERVGCTIKVRRRKNTRRYIASLPHAALIWLNGRLAPADPMEPPDEE